MGIGALAERCNVLFVPPNTFCREPLRLKFLRMTWRGAPIFKNHDVLKETEPSVLDIQRTYPTNCVLFFLCAAASVTLRTFHRSLEWGQMTCFHFWICTNLATSSANLGSQKTIRSPSEGFTGGSTKRSTPPQDLTDSHQHRKLLPLFHCFGAANRCELRSFNSVFFFFFSCPAVCFLHRRWVISPLILVRSIRVQ